MFIYTGVYFDSVSMIKIIYFISINLLGDHAKTKLNHIL